MCLQFLGTLDYLTLHPLSILVHKLHPPLLECKYSVAKKLNILQNSLVSLFP